MTTEEYNKTVDLYSDSVYRFILKNIRHKEKARDIVQDSFEKLWLNVAKVEFQKSRSYLFTVAYRRMIDVIRKEKQMTSYEGSHENHKISFQNSPDLEEILEKAISLLPEDQRSVVMLRDYEGYSYSEIEEITGLSEAQVKVYIYRARLFLKNYIGKISVLV